MFPSWLSSWELAQHGPLSQRYEPQFHWLASHTHPRTNVARGVACLQSEYLLNYSIYNHSLSFLQRMHSWLHHLHQLSCKDSRQTSMQNKTHQIRHILWKTVWSIPRLWELLQIFAWSRGFWFLLTCRSRRPYLTRFSSTVVTAYMARSYNSSLHFIDSMPMTPSNVQGPNSPL